MNTQSNMITNMPKKAGFFKRITQAREFMVFLIVLGVGIALSLASPIFLTDTNLLAVLLGLSVEAIIACGMTLIIITGGIDLSVGSTVALTGAITATCIKAGVPIVIAIFAGLLTGVAVGMINGTLHARLGINAFIITLGMMNITRGLTLILVGGLNIGRSSQNIHRIGAGQGVRHTISDHRNARPGHYRRYSFEEIEVFQAELLYWEQ